MFWKQLGKISYHTATVWNIRKGKQIYTKPSFRVSLSCSFGLTAAVFPQFGAAALTERATSGQGTGRSTAAAPGVHRNYLNLKWCHSGSFKECMCLLTKAFLPISKFHSSQNLYEGCSPAALGTVQTPKFAVTFLALFHFLSMARPTNMPPKSHGATDLRRCIRSQGAAHCLGYGKPPHH